MNTAEKIQVLPLAIISYEDFMRDDKEALSVLEKALYQNGIVGIKGIPGYQQAVLQYIDAIRAFSALPEEVKEAYAPNRHSGETFLGYERGKEKFQRPDGRWIIDDLKVSYYAFVPDSDVNKWPREVDLRVPFQTLGALMSKMGVTVMEKIGLIGPQSGFVLDNIPSLGRMLYYKGADSVADNPYWCGAHFDHGLFTALIPASYFVKGQKVPEPMEAGLFIKSTSEGVYKKIVANDPDVMMFQVGEFAQLVSNDGIRATEHRVHKAMGHIERFAMAMFFDAPMDAVIHSTSELAKDSRYGGQLGAPCSYRRWYDESFKRYIVEEEGN